MNMNKKIGIINFFIISVFISFMATNIEMVLRLKKNSCTCEKNIVFNKPFFNILLLLIFLSQMLY